jgi:hypothetical protein
VPGKCLTLIRLRRLCMRCFLFLCRVHLTALRSTTRYSLCCDTRRDTRFNHISSHSRRRSPSTFLSLTPRALGQQHPTDTSRLHAAAIHTPFLHRFSFSFITCTLSIQSPSPASPRSPYYCIHNIASRQSSAHVFKTAILLVEEGIASDDQFLQSILSLLLSFALPARPFVSPLPAAL